MRGLGYMMARGVIETVLLFEVKRLPSAVKNIISMHNRLSRLGHQQSNLKTGHPVPVYAGIFLSRQMMRVR